MPMPYAFYVHQYHRHNTNITGAGARQEEEFMGMQMRGVHHHHLGLGVPPWAAGGSRLHLHLPPPLRSETVVKGVASKENGRDTNNNALSLHSESTDFEYLAFKKKSRRHCEHEKEDVVKTNGLRPSGKSVFLEERKRSLSSASGSSDTTGPKDNGTAQPPAKRNRVSAPSAPPAKRNRVSAHSAPDTLKKARRDRKVPICTADGCTNHAKRRGVCIRHGAKVVHKRCSSEGCPNVAQVGGVCVRHGAKRARKSCSIEGCTNLVQRRGLCIRHGAKAKTKLVSWG